MRQIQGLVDGVKKICSALGLEFDVEVLGESPYCATIKIINNSDIIRHRNYIKLLLLDAVPEVAVVGDDVDYIVSASHAVLNEAGNHWHYACGLLAQELPFHLVGYSYKHADERLSSRFTRDANIKSYPYARITSDVRHSAYDLIISKITSNIVLARDNSQICIIGDDGLGKTSLLNRIGDWFAISTDYVPILVSGNSLSKAITEFDFPPFNSTAFTLLSETEKGDILRYIGPKLALLIDDCDPYCLHTKRNIEQWRCFGAQVVLTQSKSSPQNKDKCIVELRLTVSRRSIPLDG